MNDGRFSCLNQSVEEAEMSQCVGFFWEIKCGSTQSHSHPTALTLCSYLSIYPSIDLSIYLKTPQLQVIVKPPDIKTYLCIFIYHSIQFPKPNHFFLHDTFCLHITNHLCNDLNLLTHLSCFWSPYGPLCDTHKRVYNCFFSFFFLLFEPQDRHYHTVLL